MFTYDLVYFILVFFPSRKPYCVSINSLVLPVSSKADFNSKATYLHTENTKRAVRDGRRQKGLPALLCCHNSPAREAERETDQGLPALLSPHDSPAREERQRGRELPGRDSNPDLRHLSPTP